ncbi:hypothetical protein X975_19283, partial [Stegodyphus mimosarum]
MEEQLRQFMAAFAAFKEEIKAGQESVKDEMNSVQEKMEKSVKEEMKSVQVQIGYRLSSITEEFERDVSALQQQIHDRVSLVTKEVDVLKRFVATAGSNSDGFKFLSVLFPLTLSTYDGKTAWQLYKTQFCTVADANGWDSQAKTCHLAASLREHAADILQTIPETQRLDFEALSGAFGAAFRGEIFERLQQASIKIPLTEDHQNTTRYRHGYFKNNKLFSAFEAMAMDPQKGSSPRNADVSSEIPCSERCRNHTEIEEKPETTSNSPAQMLIGRDLHLSCDFLSDRPADAPSSPEKYIQDLQARFEVMHNFARERVNLATEKMKTRYDMRATGHRFNEGDKGVVMESDSSQRTFSETTVTLGWFLHSPKQAE